MMSLEIKVPVLPESVTDATVAKWYKKVGDKVERDENLVDLETDKVMLEVPAPRSGVIKKLAVDEGAVVESGVLLAVIAEAGDAKSDADDVKEEAKGAESSSPSTQEEAKGSESESDHAKEELSPAVRRLIAEKNLDASKINGSGKGGRLTVEDVEKHIQNQSSQKPAEKAQQPQAAAKTAELSAERSDKRVPMSRLRQRVAERLLQVQHEAAILTTFNEINMKPVMDLRQKYKDEFEKRHGSRLGFMSFFTKAAVEALKQFPAVNASIDGSDIVYHNYFDIGIAIGSERGLVVPIVRDADQVSMAEIEKQIRDYAAKAKDGKISLEDMSGGTFTITNAGTYGSMMSTPIINPPQSAILGMHNIVDRPVVENGEIVIRPMMYVALSYDHRIIDGREAVSFLMTIKKCIEDPARIILQLT